MVGFPQILGGVSLRTGIRVMRMALGVLAVGFALGGCGQKGPLHLPDQAPSAAKPLKPAP
jgi:predicted small lipoprotein YifL